ncbi:MAG TPA: hypothetical protein VFE61_32735 [Candidatus Sulfotelmatobacter sp.]|jgi:hypothetical protein|nr:hypothetical protein [Candidatus Sulfotelmatobacter sp.]
MKTFQHLRLATLLLASLSAAQGQVLATQRAGFALPPGQVAAPNTPGGGVVVGNNFYASDAVNGFRHYKPSDAANPDPINTGTLVFDGDTSHSLGGTSLCIFFCHVGQIAYDGNQTVYVTAYDHPKGQPGSLTFPGVWRITVDRISGVVTPGALLVPNAGLSGNLPTSTALGPDGNLYVGFLKNSNIVRIVNPTLDPTNKTQIVQSVGTAPNGHPVRSLAFVGTDLYLGTSSGLAVIKNAVASTCLGGCNGVAVSDGFPGAQHVGLATDGLNRLYMAINGQGVWRYTISTGAMHLISTGGNNPSTGVTNTFAFVGGNSNLVMLDRLGNLWIGDDTSDGAANFSGRTWYISAGALSRIP